MRKLFSARTVAAAAIIVSSLLTGCASIVNGTNQVVTVEARNKGEIVNGATCKLENDKGVFYVTTPGTVTLHRAYADLLVKCEKENITPGSATIKSSTKGMAFGNILFGGVIGAAVDAGSGAAYDYPSLITVLMGDKATATSQPSQTTSNTGNAPGGLAGINSTDKVPFVSQTCQSHFQLLKTMSTPRAFAISKDGHCGYASGFSSKTGPGDPKERAIFNCRKYTSLDCVLYFADNSVVFDKQVFEIPEAPSASVPIPIASSSSLQPGQIGQYSYQTEHLSEAKSCSTTPHAILTGKGSGFESYTVSCDNGDALAMRCDYGQCRVLK